jgi:hypothetical protein
MKKVALLIYFGCSMMYCFSQQERDIYYVGDWDGDGIDNIAIRRNATFHFDINGDGKADRTQTYGNGDNRLSTFVDHYLIGDWDGDKRDNLAVRRGSQILMDHNFDGAADKVFSFGNGDVTINGITDVYLVGDWNGDGTDNIAVRRGSEILMDYNFDGTADKVFSFGNGDLTINGIVDGYLVGDWDGDGIDNIAVRRGAEILMDYNFDETADKFFSFGNGDVEINGIVDVYMVGDWNGDGSDNIAVLRENTLYMDTNFDGAHDLTQSFGNGMSKSVIYPVLDKITRFQQEYMQHCTLPPYNLDPEKHDALNEFFFSH